MKKAYVKPKISFESFAFSSNIAAGCSDIYGIQSQDTCASFGTFRDPITGACQFIDNGYSVFYENACLQTPQENDEHNLCYHVSTDETRMFAS